MGRRRRIQTIHRETIHREIHLDEGEQRGMVMEVNLEGT